MSLNPIIEPLRRVPLFDGLTPLQITEIARHAERIMFRDGKVIVAAGDTGDKAFVIIGGDVVCTGGIHCSAADNPEPLPPGTLLSEMSMLIDDHRHLSTFVAKGPVRAIALTREALHAQMSADPALADHFVQKIAARLGDIATELRRIDEILVPPQLQLPAPQQKAAASLTT